MACPPRLASAAASPCDTAKSGLWALKGRLPAPVCPLTPTRVTTSLLAVASHLPDLEADSLEALARAVDALGDEGERRAQQEEMTAAVSRAIVNDGHLAVRAGTGVGKSLAYLIPAALSGRRTVVSTATRALQDQLNRKELPFVAELLPPRFGEGKDRPLRWVVLKGRSNYLCLQRLEEELEGRLLPSGGHGFPEGGLETFIEWSKITSTGDRSEFPGRLPAETWARFSVSSNQCPGRSLCRHGSQCFTEQSRRHARQADVVIVNSALLATSLTGTESVPSPDLFVIDEAHAFAEVVSRIAGATLHHASFEEVAKAAESVEEGLGSPLRNSGAQIAQHLERHAGQSVSPDEAPDLWDALILAGERLAEARQGLMDNQTMELIFDAEVAKRSGEARRQRSIATAGALREEINRFLDPAEGCAMFVDRHAHSLRLAPLDVSELLQDGMYEGATVILTSATLDESAPASLGLNEDSHQYLDLGSPFDYRKAGLFYCAAHLPGPRDDPFVRNDALADELEELINAAGGRTLALFTSWRVLEEVHGKLEGRLRWPLLRQQTHQATPAAEFLREFAANKDACLFATMSFWQGVDVPGPSLSLVALDKLPFPPMNDPLINARRDHAGRDRSFAKVDLPHCAVLLAQGAGRLIRSSGDRGVVALLDPRLPKAGYRNEVLKLMPPFKRTIDKGDVLAFLRGLRRESP